MRISTLGACCLVLQCTLMHAWPNAAGGRANSGVAMCAMASARLFCSSLAWQTDADVALTAKLAAQAGVTVVSLPLVNEWTQVALLASCVHYAARLMILLCALLTPPACLRRLSLTRSMRAGGCTGLELQFHGTLLISWPCYTIGPQGVQHIDCDHISRTVLAPYCCRTMNAGRQMPRRLGITAMQEVWQIDGNSI